MIPVCLPVDSQKDLLGLRDCILLPMRGPVLHTFAAKVVVVIIIIVTVLAWPLVAHWLLTVRRGRRDRIRKTDIVEKVGETAADAPQLDVLGRYSLPRPVQIVPTDSRSNVPHLALRRLGGLEKGLRGREKVVSISSKCQQRGFNLIEMGLLVFTRKSH